MRPLPLLTKHYQILPSPCDKAIMFQMLMPSLAWLHRQALKTLNRIANGGNGKKKSLGWGAQLECSMLLYRLTDPSHNYSQCLPKENTINTTKSKRIVHQLIVYGFSTVLNQYGYTQSPCCRLVHVRYASPFDLRLQHQPSQDCSVSYFNLHHNHIL